MNALKGYMQLNKTSKLRLEGGLRTMASAVTHHVVPAHGCERKREACRFSSTKRPLRGIALVISYVESNCTPWG